MHKFNQWILKTLLLAAGVFFYASASAGFVHINRDGGTTSGDGLHFIIDDTTQLQVVRNRKGQVFNDKSTPDRPWAVANLGYTDARSVLERLDNGVYLRADKKVYGPKHLAIAANSTLVNTTALTYSSITAATPATISQGQTQQTTSKFKLPPAGPEVEITWSYIFPYDFITANVKIRIPDGYPVSATNHVRYFHVIDTYLGGDDNGCGVMYSDPKGKQVIGTYPRISGGCPKSDGLPAGLDTVETFRERDGTFSSWCVGYYEFWGEGGSLTDCNITTTQASNSTAPALNKTVSKVYKDTAMAIEYDFTAPGDYTFSYDFVVGSTAVPAYDHLEVRHPGTSSLCPVNVQVLACLSSAVPCPDNQLIYSGDLTGDLTLTPGIPAVSKSPNQQFSIGSNGPIWTYALQGSSAGVYTFGYSGLNAAPLNGLKCWNTTTNSQSCSFAINNTPCVDKFECMENTLTYKNLTTSPSERNPLYTKVFGKDLDVDVVAVLASGAQSSGYNATLGLTVDLVVESGNSCGPTVVASQTVPFATADNGRKKVTFNASAANMLLGTYPKNASPILRCKVRDLTLNKSGCSSDNFALRPQAFTVSSLSSNFTQTTIGPTVPSPRKAWTDNFNLMAATGETNYTGTPKILASRVLAHTGDVSLGKFGYGVPNPNALPPYIPPAVTSFPTAVNGISSGDGFLYSEVGFFRFDQFAVYDETFTDVDRAKGDCNNEDMYTLPSTVFNSNSFNNNGGKNGCRFGNVNATNYFGRFIPDHFRIEKISVTKACSNNFTYYGQDVSPNGGVAIPFNVYAENGANEITQYYTGIPGAGIYAKFNPADWLNYKFTTTPNLGKDNELKSVFNPALPTGWTSGKVFVDAKFKVDRPGTKTAPQSVTFNTEISDSDNTVTKPTPKIALDNTTQFRYGRLAIPPVHGSELLPLPVKVETQYWDGSAENSYRRSTDDNCTTIPLSSIAMKTYKGQLNACETQLSMTSPMSNGVLNLRLSAPGVASTTPITPNTGSVDLEVNLGAAIPGEKTCLGVTESAATSGSLPWFGTVDPSGRASFGIYKAPIIYMRENF